jgi:hypothetical protein
MESQISNASIDLLEKELQELEDSYAECLADDVDLGTLRMLWLRMKAIKRELLSRERPTPLHIEVKTKQNFGIEWARPQYRRS